MKLFRGLLILNVALVTNTAFAADLSDLEARAAALEQRFNETYLADPEFCEEAGNLEQELGAVEMKQLSTDQERAVGAILNTSEAAKEVC